MGGYDSGYKNCDCFWGKKPGSLIGKLEDNISSFYNKRVLDAGCGEGKNACYIANKGAYVDAVDISLHAIKNGKIIWGKIDRINWMIRDICKFDFNYQYYNIVIAYGLLHCIDSMKNISILINKLMVATANNGYFIFCAFNDRHQDLSAHPGFKPTLIGHTDYLNFFKDWDILFSSDEDLYETHPHNNIPHSHSLTRILAKKTTV